MNGILGKVTFSVVALFTLVGQVQCNDVKILQPGTREGSKNVLSEKSKSRILDNKSLGKGLMATLPVSKGICTVLSTRPGKRAAENALIPLYTCLRADGLRAGTLGMKLLYFLSGIKASSEAGSILTVQNFTAGVLKQAAYLPQLSIPLFITGVYIMLRTRNSETVKK